MSGKPEPKKDPKHPTADPFVYVQTHITRGSFEFKTDDPKFDFDGAFQTFLHTLKDQGCVVVDASFSYKCREFREHVQSDGTIKSVSMN